MKREKASIRSTTLTTLGQQANAGIDKIEPPFWFAGMKSTQLQLLVYGKDIGTANVTVDYPGVLLDYTARLSSHNYLLIYLRLSQDVQPGFIPLTFTFNNSCFVERYELRKRARNGDAHRGFSAADTLYLLMPDRFACTTTDLSPIENMAEYQINRKDPDARHGGNLAGIEQHLDYFVDLGITALWLTPVLENNMKGGSYHGYAITDYYNVDPRLGTNESYRQLIEKAHKCDLKIVMDMIFNHCGADHPWVKDMPSPNWFNNPDYKTNYVQTSFKLTPHVDPYASQYDFNQMNSGWFDLTMPDLNQKNYHVYRYLVQNSFWWIEFANIDGIRMDTYPYADYNAMSHWMEELNEEYPNFNTVGETWVTEPAYTAWWQKDSKLSEPQNSHLKTVMDFSFFERINMAKNEQTGTWFTGLDRIYNNFVYDFLYPHPESVLAFIENHDTNRFLGEGADFPLLRQAITLLLTTRRIPQLLYGTEVLMNGTKDGKSDGYVRKDFPGGWPNDPINAFTPEGRSAEQNECYDFYKTILNWRKGKANDIIAKGNMTQFIIQNGVYAYARQYRQQTIFVMLNGTDQETTISLLRYKEILKDKTEGKDILTGKTIPLGSELHMSPRESLILELQQEGGGAIIPSNIPT